MGKRPVRHLIFQPVVSAKKLARREKSLFTKVENFRIIQRRMARCQFFYCLSGNFIGLPVMKTAIPFPVWKRSSEIPPEQ